MSPIYRQKKPYEEAHLYKIKGTKLPQIQVLDRPHIFLKKKFSMNFMMHSSLTLTVCVRVCERVCNKSIL